MSQLAWPDLFERVAPRLEGVTKADSQGWVKFRCPAHENHQNGDRHASGRANARSGGVKCMSQNCPIGPNLNDLAAYLGVDCDDPEASRNGDDPLHRLARERMLSPSVLHDKYGVLAASGGWAFPVDDADAKGNPHFKRDPMRWADEGAPKNWWPKGQNVPAKDLVYGLSHIDQGTKVIYAAAGEIDAITLLEAGCPAVTFLAGEGTPPSAKAVQKLIAQGIEEVRFVYDVDAAGRDGAPNAGQACSREGLQVRIVSLPDDLGAAGDINDLWKRCNGDHSAFDDALLACPVAVAQPSDQELKSAVEYPLANGASPHGESREIFAGEGDLPTITGDAWAAIKAANEPPFLFRHAGLPVRIEVEDGTPGLKQLGLDKMRHVMARAAVWYRIKEVVPPGQSEKEKVRVPARPPVDVVRDVLATPDMPLPVLSRLVEAPVFASDGTLQIKPGYHPAGRTYYRPAPGFTMPELAETPTADDVHRARKLLCDDLLGDFPFATDADRAHAICLLLLPFVRDLIPGATPLHLIEKPSPGTGASLLADVVAYPATGRPVTAMTEGRDEDEWRKRITARLLASPAFVLIDNLRKRLESSALSSAITSIVWEDRVLGLSETARVPVRCAWLATGNNPTVSAEIARRVVRIRLDAKTDRPWLRGSGEFRHPNLRAWAVANRAVLGWAALTMTKAWLAAGRPNAVDVPTLGMFEDWAAVMGGILHVAGIPGFLGNLTEFYNSADSDGEQWRALVQAWWDAWKGEAVGVGALFQLISSDEYTVFDLGDGNERSQKSKLGRALKGARDRQYEGLRITAAGTRSHAAQWKLVQADQPTLTPKADDGDVAAGTCRGCGQWAYVLEGVCKPCEALQGAAE